MSRLGIGIVGLGRIANTHLDAIRQMTDSVELAGVVDVREDLVEQFASKTGATPYLSLNAALEDPRIEAVIVCLPHHLHAPVCKQIAEAGRHVLVEKVMALDVAEGEAMVAAAEANDVRLMVAHSRRFNRHLQNLKERIASGEIGRVLNLLYTFTVKFSSASAPPWWRSEASTGGLIYPMVGSHTLDFTLWMMDDREPVSVYAAGSSSNPEFEGDDDATVIVSFADGTHATNFLSINTHPAKHGALIVGEAGSASFSRSGSHGGRLLGVGSFEVYVNDEKVGSGESEPHEFVGQLSEFVAAIRERREPLSSGKSVIKQLRLIAAARESAATGKVVAI